MRRKFLNGRLSLSHNQPQPIGLRCVPAPQSHTAGVAGLSQQAKKAPLSHLMEPFCSPEAVYRLNQTCDHFAHLYPDYGIFWNNNAPHPNLWPISYATETAGRMSHKPSQGSLISLLFSFVKFPTAAKHIHAFAPSAVAAKEMARPTV